MYSTDGLDPVFALYSRLDLAIENRKDMHPALKFLKSNLTPGPAIPFSVKLKVTPVTDVVVVGCGGTGSHLVPNILQYLDAKNKKDGIAIPNIVLIDGDSVEEKNLIRQRFVHSDLGKNKAEALALRYSSAFGMAISYSNKYLENHYDITNILSLSPTPANGLRKVLIIGCVDNHFARRIIHNYYSNDHMSHSFGSVWVDSGNESWHGQAILACNSAHKMKTKIFAELKPGGTIGQAYLPNYFDIYPDEYPLSETAPVLEGNVCAQTVIEDPQTIQANMMSSFCATSLAIQVLSGEVRTSAIFFDAKTGATKSLQLTPDSLVSSYSSMILSTRKILESLKALTAPATNLKECIAALEHRLSYLDD